MCPERPLTLKNLQVANTNGIQPLKYLFYFFSYVAMCFAETYLKILSYHRQGFINLDQSFIQGLNKIRQFLLHTF